jgi:hypothetical protein
VGPSLGKDDIRLIEGMRKSYVSLEYLMLDETALPQTKHQYQMKERGYEIL